MKVPGIHDWEWPEGRELLFATWHGSHLYGTAHADSDRDLYVVLTKVPHSRAAWSRQRIDGDLDITMIDLGTFVDQCVKGVPQALEAMFAPEPLYDAIGGLRASWRCGTAVWPTYRRTIRHFVEAGDEKHAVHALRLSWNLFELTECGRFDPRLPTFVRKWARDRVDSLSAEELLELALDFPFARHY